MYLCVHNIMSLQIILTSYYPGLELNCCLDKTRHVYYRLRRSVWSLIVLLNIHLKLDSCSCSFKITTDHFKDKV